MSPLEMTSSLEWLTIVCALSKYFGGLALKDIAAKLFDPLSTDNTEVPAVKMLQNVCSLVLKLDKQLNLDMEDIRLHKVTQLYRVFRHF